MEYGKYIGSIMALVRNKSKSVGVHSIFISNNKEKSAAESGDRFGKLQFSFV